MLCKQYGSCEFYEEHKYNELTLPAPNPTRINMHET